MNAYPLLLEPILKPRVWGGRRLAALGKDLPPGEPIGESWEVADLPETVEGGRSVITNGPLAGTTLRAAITAHQATIMGAVKLTGDGGFPLLIKYLDARQNLSVQVHPTAEYVRRHPGAHVKSEAWVILAATTGAVIYKGVKPGVTRERLAAHLEAGTAVDDLVAVPVARGDCHYLPSGTCHALGAGVLVAEVQTPSDTTFRVYDWGRAGRALHVREALECIDFDGTGTEESAPAAPIEVEGIQTLPLLDTEHFGIERIETLEPSALEVVTNGMPVIWMLLAGAGSLHGGGIDVRLRPGTTVLLPAALSDGRARVDAGCTLLRVSPPSPLRGMIA